MQENLSPLIVSLTTLPSLCHFSISLVLFFEQQTEHTSIAFHLRPVSVYPVSEQGRVEGNVLYMCVSFRSCVKKDGK